MKLTRFLIPLVLALVLLLGAASDDIRQQAEVTI